CSDRCASILLFNPSATSPFSPLSLHDALPILRPLPRLRADHAAELLRQPAPDHGPAADHDPAPARPHHQHQLDRRAGQLAAVLRSEEHTSELQSRENLVCRLLLEKKETNSNTT